MTRSCFLLLWLWDLGPVYYCSGGAKKVLLINYTAIDFVGGRRVIANSLRYSGGWWQPRRRRSILHACLLALVSLVSVYVAKFGGEMQALSVPSTSHSPGWCCVWCGISIMKLPTAKAHSKMRGNRGARARHDTPTRLAGPAGTLRASFSSPMV